MDFFFVFLLKYPMVEEMRARSRYRANVSRGKYPTAALFQGEAEAPV